MAFQLFIAMYSLAPTTDAFEFTQFSISYPSFFPLFLLSFNLGTSDHVYSVAPGSGVVLQQHKPQLDGCQCPFSNRSLQKANSGQGSAGSPTDLWAAPSARQSTSAGLPELPPLPGQMQPLSIRAISNQQAWNCLFFLYAHTITYL